MKKLLMILIACLMPYGVQAFPTNINSKTIDIAKLKNDFKDYKFNLKGFDSQHFTFTFINNGVAETVTSLSFAFKASQRRGSSNLVFISIANSDITKATNSIDFGFAATNVPPDGTYKAEILAFEGANTNLSRTFGRGTLVVLESLYDDVDGTFPFPGTITNLLDFLTITSAVATYYPLTNPSNFTSTTAATGGLASVVYVDGATNKNFIDLTNEIRIATNVTLLDAAALDVLATNKVVVDLSAVIVASTNQNLTDANAFTTAATGALALVRVNTNFLVAAGTGLLGGGHMSGTNVTLRLDPAVTSSLVVAESDPLFTTFTNGGGDINGELSILSGADLIFGPGTGTNVPAIIFNVERGHVSMNTVDGSDSNVLTLVAGGPDGSKPTRGGSIDLIGNEGSLSTAPGGGGTVHIQAGSVAGALIALADQNNLDSVVVTNGQVNINTTLQMNAGIIFVTSNAFDMAAQLVPLRNVYADGSYFIDGFPVSRSSGNLTYLGSNLVFEAIFILATNALDLTHVSTGVVLVAGTGLDGGGPLTNNMTFSLEPGATNTFLLTTTFDTVTNQLFLQKVDTNVTVTAGTGLTGGGKLTNNVTLNLDPLATNGLATEIFVTNTALLAANEKVLQPFRDTFRLAYSDGSTNWQEVSLGANNTFLKSQGAGQAPTFELFQAITTNVLLGELADNPPIFTFIMAVTNLTDQFYSNASAALMRTNMAVVAGLDVMVFSTASDALRTNNGAAVQFVNANLLDGIDSLGFLQFNEVGALTAQGSVTNDPVVRDVMISSDGTTNFFWGSIATDIPTNLHISGVKILTSNDGTNLYWKVDDSAVVATTNTLDEILGLGNASIKTATFGGITNTGISILDSDVAIGTNSPGHDLHVVDPTTVQITAQYNTTGTTSVAGIDVRDAIGANDRGGIFYAHESYIAANAMARADRLSVETGQGATGMSFNVANPNGSFKFHAGSTATVANLVLEIGTAAHVNIGGKSVTNLADGVETNAAVTLRQLQVATNGLPVRTAIKVNSTNDLPATSGGVQTLLPNTTYLIDGTIVATVPVVFSNGSVVVGLNPSVDVWAYQGSDTAFIASNNNAVLRNFTVSAASGRAFICGSTGLSHQVELRELIFSCVNVAEVGPMDLFSMSRCQWASVTGTGVVFVGSSSNEYVTIVDNDVKTVGTAMVALDFGSSEVHDITIGRNLFRHPSAAFSISGALASSNIVNDGFAIVEVNSFPTTPLDIVTKRDKSWNFIGNQHITDSTVGGDMYMTNAGLSVVVVQDVPTNVLTDAYFGVDLEGVIVATNGVLTLDSLEDEELVFDITIEIAPASGNDKVLRAHLKKNDVIQPLNNGKVTVSSGDPQQINIHARVDSTPGDTFRVAVENTTDSINIVVDKITVRVTK